MASHLVMRLYGPLAAWGEIAVGIHRHTASHPSRSGVLGLVAGALGIRRDDADALSALHEGYGFACRVDLPGSLLTDYHTVQVPPQKEFRRSGPPRTRRQALARPRHRLSTILSRRDYLEDSLAIACLWARPGAPHSLETLATAMRRPHFTPYLGRRSCPPALPFHPQVVEAPSPVRALAQARFPDGPFLRALEPLPCRDYYWEDDDPAIRPLTSALRRDQAGDRLRWQFAERLEHHATEEELRDVPQQD